MPIEQQNIRRSGRNRNKKKDDTLALHLNILTDPKHGLEIVSCGDIGRGIATTKPFNRGDFLCSYKGDLLSKAEADEREARYEIQHPEDMCYTHYFRYNEITRCVDATAEDDSNYGRLVNHSKTQPNARAKVEVIEGSEHHYYVYLVAEKYIETGTEIRYNYGDRKSELPWLQL